MPTSMLFGWVWLAGLLAVIQPARADAVTTAAPATSPTAPTYETATFAGGCFWCMEPPFDELKGVISTTVGYMGGHSKYPTYAQVSAGNSGHLEVIQIVYNPSLVSYEQLLDVFWRNVDPTDAGGQFCDRGPQYTTAIFVHSEAQRSIAERSKKALATHKRLPGPVHTPIRTATTFWPAEAYHQDYYQKNPLRYKYYRLRCGRDARLEALWGEAEEAPKP